MRYSFQVRAQPSRSIRSAKGVGISKGRTLHRLLPMLPFFLFSFSDPSAIPLLVIDDHETESVHSPSKRSPSPKRHKSETSDSERSLILLTRVRVSFPPSEFSLSHMCLSPYLGSILLCPLRSLPSPKERKSEFFFFLQCSSSVRAFLWSFRDPILTPLLFFSLQKLLALLEAHANFRLLPFLVPT